MSSFCDPNKVIFIQSRAGFDEATIVEYTRMMENGVEFDDAQALMDTDGTLYVWDGGHRGEAAKRTGKLLSVNIRVGSGTRAEAEWLALTANRKHGLRRSRADVQRVVRSALLHPNGTTLSDREVGRHCGVDHGTVGRMRKELELTGELHQSAERTGADGRTINTTNIGGAQPEYVSVVALEMGVRRWLDSYADLAGRLRALGLIKARTNHGVELLEKLLTGDALPGPRRKGDAIQAVHNVLDQLQQQPYPNPETVPPGLACPRCGGGVRRLVGGRILECVVCGGDWPDVEAFEEEIGEESQAARKLGEIEVAPAAEASAPRKILDPTGELTRQAQKICSADTLNGDRLRGVIEIEGKTYACTSAAYADKYGYQEADLIEVVPFGNHSGPTTSYEEITKQNIYSYTDQLVGCKGKSWVMTDRRVTLRWEFEPHKRPATEARPAAIWQLQQAVTAWLAKQAPEPPGYILELMKEQPRIAGAQWLDKLLVYLAGDWNMHYNPGDLTQAIANLLEQDRADRRREVERAEVEAVKLELAGSLAGLLQAGDLRAWRMLVYLSSHFSTRDTILAMEDSELCRAVAKTIVGQGSNLAGPIGDASHLQTWLEQFDLAELLPAQEIEDQL